MMSSGLRTRRGVVVVVDATVFVVGATVVVDATVVGEHLVGQCPLLAHC